MKFLITFVVLCAAITNAAAGGGYGGGSSGGSSYGSSSASIPAPPCSNNYLFSCQPSMQPAPCASQQSSGYGSSGSYSENVPRYIAAPYNGLQYPH